MALSNEEKSGIVKDYGTSESDTGSPEVTGENRVLAHFGLERLRTSQCRTGFLSLLEAAKKRPETLSFKDIGFSIGPRINAAGRMESGLRAVELLRSKDKEEQDQLANAINDFNTDRRSAQAEIFEEAKALIDAAAFPQFHGLIRTALAQRRGRYCRFKNGRTLL